MPERFWEIDLARGIAVLLMITFHTAFDISFLKMAEIPLWGTWKLLAYSAAFLFVFIAGVCMSISRSKALNEKKNVTIKFFKKGMRIFALGMVVTAASFVFLENGFILYGVLHFIGTATILSLLFFGLGRFNVIAAIVFAVASLFISGVHGPLWLLWTGIHPQGFYSLDYFPVIPWFGVVLAGIYAGDTLYPMAKRSVLAGHVFSKKHDGVLSRLLCIAGRNSLMIYFIHQPVILAFLFLASL